MENITIEMISKSHAEELLKFERENRDFFEVNLPPRADEYYCLENLQKILDEIIMEQEDGLCYMYLIRNESNEIIGRVNLFSVIRGILQKAEIGYRIGEEYNGCGYATKAVKLVIDKAFNEHNLHRIEAGTSPANIGSQIVLIKNGFEFIGRTRQVININEKWEDGIIFEKINDIKN
ncbi:MULTISPECIES: GNAT family N-acetyltransferase [Psychrilyobacter]|uniref:GNAT family N-acetyltransferase n=1 Tax=Psychrilyobacter piezotolerans TaxID=2293438 RepID=A0ABX9KEE0_9FUSO|nr:MULTISPECIES: GNAT family protein [Psychrilyobacter]MCS5422524.1 GNAT family N-acetyltransferase [Psychrilyobacter sp. S5]NDI78736.1 GNAT family N-acetyltransferase [Psychrilyobacter piezotolerans]RDE59585.1 N-acetyltransferase [Psychrilyobacter sp. S5]REI39999.1 GNAT family N-acetyltransferase [Psychrilyobacter piezotolerans]